MNGQVIDIKGRDVLVAYHPDSGEPRLGEAMLLTERGGDSADGVVAQVISFESAGYPGDREATLHELLEKTIAERHEVVQGEPALSDLKQIKIVRLKIRRRMHDGLWLPWEGGIPTRNLNIGVVSPQELLGHVVPQSPAWPFAFAHYDSTTIELDAHDLDKVNVLVGDKGTGKSHSGKHLLRSITGMGAAVWVFDRNREFVDLPGAAAIRIGDNYRLSLAEVGFSFLMAIVDDINPLTDVSRGAFENNGARFMQQEIARTGFATIGYLLERAERGDFHSNDMVNTAIETRLRMVGRTGLFEEDPTAKTLAERFDEAVAAGGFLVFDLAEQPQGRVTALTRGLLRRVEAICQEERRTGRGRYPFVFFEEAHMYTAPAEILNLITRGRHLGITTFFMTNSPSQLPEVIFRQLDNLIVTGLSHSADLRLIAKSALSDEETLQSLAVSLAPNEALIIGRITGGFPLVVQVDALPPNFPTTGATRSFWDRPKPK